MASGTIRRFCFLRVFNVFQAFYDEYVSSIIVYLVYLFKDTVKTFVKLLLLAIVFLLLLGKGQVHHQNLRQKKKGNTSEKVHGKVRGWATLAACAPLSPLPPDQVQALPSLVRTTPTWDLKEADRKPTQNNQYHKW